MPSLIPDVGSTKMMMQTLRGVLPVISSPTIWRLGVFEALHVYTVIYYIDSFVLWNMIFFYFKMTVDGG